MWTALRTDPFLAAGRSAHSAVCAAATRCDRRTMLARGDRRRPFARACLPVLRGRRYPDRGRPVAAAHQLERAGTGIEPEANPLQLWLDSTGRGWSSSAPDTLVLPSHRAGLSRPATRGPRSCASIMCTNSTCCAAPGAAATAAPPLRPCSACFRACASPVDDMLALGESIAHLSWLRYEGCCDGCWTRTACTASAWQIELLTLY